MTDKTPIGIPVLDDALGGGVPRGYVILLEVDTGTRPDAFISTFLATGLNKGELAYIFCSEYPLRIPFDQLRNKGIDVDQALKSKQLVGIDAFTDAFGWGEFEPESEFSVHDLGNSRHVHDTIRKVVLAMEPKNNLRGVVDSLTSILHSARELDDAINYMHHQMSAQKNHGNILLYTLAREAHDEEDLRLLEHVADGVIALYKIYNEEGWQIACQIEKMRGVDFNPLLYLYAVEDGNITLTPFSEFEEEEEEGEEEEEAKVEEVEEEEGEEEEEAKVEEVEEVEEEEEEEEEEEVIEAEMLDSTEVEEEPVEPETTPPPVPPVPEPEEAPKPEPDSFEDESRTPSEPIIFDEPTSTEEPAETTPDQEEDSEDSDDEDQETFFF